MELTLPRLDRVDGLTAVPWLLRLGVAMCFVGHGAFGIITKSAWLPYFDLLGISETWAWRLMPWIGTMDVAVGMMALAHPCRALFAWATTWTTGTALLRPLAGEGWSEFFERAGNYGVPLAILLVVGVRAPWLMRLPDRWPLGGDPRRRRLAWTLRITTATLLAGHAGCAVLLHNTSLAHHYGILWPRDAHDIVSLVGCIEFLLALAVFAWPTPALLLAIVVWKLGTELLFLGSGVPAPVFEVIERAGSYVAPLALALILRQARLEAGKTN